LALDIAKHKESLENQCKCLSISKIKQRRISEDGGDFPLIQGFGVAGSDPLWKGAEASPPKQP
jgi:hypothetical protein